MRFFGCRGKFFLLQNRRVKFRRKKISYSDKMANAAIFLDILILQLSFFHGNTFMERIFVRSQVKLTRRPKLCYLRYANLYSCSKHNFLTHILSYTNVLNTEEIALLLYWSLNRFWHLRGVLHHWSIRLSFHKKLLYNSHLLSKRFLLNTWEREFHAEGSCKENFFWKKSKVKRFA